MDQDQDNSHEESYVNLLTLPIELLVYIISFLSSLHDRVNLRYVSRWLRCVVEETPSLWKEFVWPYYNSHGKCIVKALLKMCGKHVKVLSFPYCRGPSTPIVMLQYCSNVQHVSLPSTKLDPKQLQKITRHLGCLQTLEFKVDHDSDIEQLFSNTSHLKEIMIISDSGPPIEDLFKYWKENECKPPSCSVIADGFTKRLGEYAAQITTIPAGTTSIFTVFSKYHKVCSKFSPSLPCLQLHVDASGQVSISCVKLSDCVDLIVMNDCQYDGRTMCTVRLREHYNELIMNLMNIAKPHNLKCATHFDLSCCYSLHSGHLEQLAIACPNLQRLNLEYCYDCLKSLQGLRAIATHCQNLQGLNLFGICVSEVEDHILLWEILSNMELTHLAPGFCILRPEVANKEIFICLLQKCSIRGIQCELGRSCHCDGCWKIDTLMLSYLTTLHYCHLEYYGDSATVVQEMINNCKELKYLIVTADNLSLNLAHNHNLQQLYIEALRTDVPDHFMTSVSAHGGLVHVVMSVQSLTAESITSLVRNSPKLITLLFNISRDRNATKNLNATLRKMFSKRKLFTAGYCNVNGRRYMLPAKVLQGQGTDLLPLWN